MIWLILGPDLQAKVLDFLKTFAIVKEITKSSLPSECRWLRRHGHFVTVFQRIVARGIMLGRILDTSWLG